MEGDHGVSCLVAKGIVVAIVAAILLLALFKGSR
jgi:hypothetical protein